MKKQNEKNLINLYKSGIKELYEESNNGLLRRNCQLKNTLEQLVDQLRVNQDKFEEVDFTDLVFLGRNDQ